MYLPGPCTDTRGRAALCNNRATVCLQCPCTQIDGDVSGCGAPVCADCVELGPGRPPDPQHQPGRTAGPEVVAAGPSVRSGLPGESRCGNHRVSSQSHRATTF